MEENGKNKIYPIFKLGYSGWRSTKLPAVNKPQLAKNKRTDTQFFMGQCHHYNYIMLSVNNHSQFAEMSAVYNWLHLTPIIRRTCAIHKLLHTGIIFSITQNTTVSHCISQLRWNLLTSFQNLCDSKSLFKFFI